MVFAGVQWRDLPEAATVQRHCRSGDFNKIDQRRGAADMAMKSSIWTLFGHRAASENIQDDHWVALQIHSGIVPEAEMLRLSNITARGCALLWK
jgi:hypothetical protein